MNQDNAPMTVDPAEYAALTTLMIALLATTYKQFEAFGHGRGDAWIDTVSSASHAAIMRSGASPGRSCPLAWISTPSGKRQFST
jgi:hypothetical protein